MISNGRLWQTVNQIAKSTTSGYQSEEEWNRDLYSVQWSVISLLCDNYENNQKVSDALVNHVIISDETTNSFGVLPITGAGSGSDVDGNNYYRTLAVNLVVDDVEYPATKVNINERATTQTSPIRKMRLDTHRVGYSFGENSLLLLPEDAMNIRWYYCKKPVEATLVLTTVSTDDSDYQEVDETATTDLEFPESLFNIFTYEMLQRLGIEQKDNLITEYSQLGINYQTKTEVA